MAKTKQPVPKSKLSIKQRSFLAAFEKCGQITLAARSANVTRTVHHQWMAETSERSDEYRNAFEDAKAVASESLEMEARRRAVEGVNEPVIYKGELMGLWVNGKGERVSAETKGAKFIPLTVKKYSDMLLMALLNANVPDKFRPRKDEQPKDDPERPPEQIVNEILDYLGEDNGDGSAGPVPV